MLSFIALALSAATLVVTILIAIRLKTVHYLLQQPVVKKMSPQLRLKPVKLDDAGNRVRENRDGNREGRPENRGERRDGRNENRGERRDGNREGRGENRGERREGREGRPEGERRENRDGRNENRGERRDGNRDGRGENRGERREGREGRPEGERRENRDGRNENRGERREHNGERREGRENRPPREFGDAPRAESSAVVEAPVASEAPAGLPPRRPLNATPEAPRAEAAAPAGESGFEATFVGSGDDVQHGRRTQLKKKPRFDIEEETTTPAV